MTVINTNINSYSAQVEMKKVDRDLNTNMERLSSGFRINAADDDAAGLAITERMTSQIRGANMAARHAADAISMLQTAEGALTEVSNLMQRMRELAVQATSETYSSSDLAKINTEYQELEEEVSRIVSQTKWNTIGLLDGTGGSSTNGTFKIQVGADSGMTIDVTIGTMSTAANAALNDLAGLAVDTLATASHSISKIDLAFEDLNTKRANFGAAINRLTHAQDNILNFSVNQTQSRSRILDTDYAFTMAELAKTNIVRQAGIAMLAQANTQPQAVLQLLQ